MRALHLNFLIMLFLLASPAMGQGVWVNALGPEGADATAFYVDEENRYWLGTGSSGGVYRSGDLGKSWIPINAGIGAAHISWIGKIDGSLYAELADADSLVQSWQATHHFRMYRYRQTPEGWDRVSDEDNIRLQQQALQQSKQRYEQLRSKYPKVAIGPMWGGSSKESYINRYGQEEAPAPWWASYIDGDSIAQTPSMELPPMSFLRHWNFYENERGQLVALSNSGGYTLIDSRWIPLAKEGLVATDVHFFANASDSSLYVKANYDDIAQFAQKTWASIQGSAGEVSPQSSFRMNASIKGAVVTTAGGNVIRLKGRRSEVLFEKREYTQKTLPPILKSYLKERDSYIIDDEHFYLWFHNAAYDRKGNLWAYAELNSEFLLLRIREGDILSVGHEEVKGLWEEFGTGSFLASNPITGDLWFFGDKHVIWLDQPEVKFPFHLDYSTGQLGGLVAFAPDGRMAYPLIVDSQTSEAEQIFLIRTNGREGLEAKSYLAPLKYITCLGFDHKGSLFAGTGYFTTNNADYCAWGLQGSAMGLYKLSNRGWDAVLDEPNNWILSLGYHPTNGIWVGTSGSGLWQYQPAGYPYYPSTAMLYQNGKMGVEQNGYPIIPPRYNSIRSYKQYYRHEGHLSHIRYSPEDASNRYLVLEDGDGKFRLSSKGGELSGAYHGFCHTSLSSLLAYNILEMNTEQWSVDEDARFEFYRVESPSQLTPLPYQRIWTFEKGCIGEALSSNGKPYYQLCDFQLRPIAYNRFSDFQQVNGQLILTEGESSYLWSLEKWAQVGKLPIAKVFPSNGHIHQMSNEDESLFGLIDDRGWKEVLPLSEWDFRPFGSHYLIVQHGKKGLFHTQRESISLPPIYDRIEKGVGSSYFVGSGEKIGVFDLKQQQWEVPLSYRFEKAQTRRAQEQEEKDGFEEEVWGFSASPHPSAFPLPEIWTDSLENKGIYDRAQGKWILEPMAYQSFDYLFDGYYRVGYGKNQGLFNLDLEKWTIPLKGFSKVEIIKGDLLDKEQLLAGYILAQKDNLKQGVYDLQADGWILEPIYNELQFYEAPNSEERLFLVKKAGKYGVFSLEKGLVVPFKHALIDVDPENPRQLRLYKKISKKPKKVYEIE